MSFYREAGGGGVMFLLRLVCAHLINVNNCCYGRCYGKSRILLIRFLKSRCFNAGNRVRLFQDSIPKCLKFTILPFKKSDFCNLTSPFLSIRPPQNCRKANRRSFERFRSFPKISEVYRRFPRRIRKIFRLYAKDKQFIHHLNKEKMSANVI